MKNRIETSVGKLMVSRVPKRPWIHLMVDSITELLLVAGKNVILVVYDKLFKIIHFVITMEVI